MHRFLNAVVVTVGVVAVLLLGAFALFNWVLPSNAASYVAPRVQTTNLVAATETPAAQATSCPKFGGVQTTPISGEDGCKLDNGQTPVTDKVPSGFYAHYNNGTSVVDVPENTSITSATASFYPMSKFPNITQAMPTIPSVSTGPTCLTTQVAKNSTKVDVQRIGTEPCSWVWRSFGKATVVATCPDGWMCTLHLNDDHIQVIKGDGKTYTIKAGTFRFVAGFDQSDAVHDACQLLAKEQGFGQGENPSFPVEAGNFTCP